MSDRHVIELLPEYALGTLEESESALVAEHLVHCEACRQEFGSYQEATDLMALATPLEDPPEDLKEKVLENVTRPAVEKSKTRTSALREQLEKLGLIPLSPFGLASILVISGLILTSLVLWGQTRSPFPQDSLEVITLRSTELNPAAEGLLVVEKDGHDGTLVVNNLEPLAEGSQYQLWLIEGGNRSSAGVFSVSENGYGWLYIELDLPLPEYTGFGITIEPEGGSSVPTSGRVLGIDIDP